MHIQTTPICDNALQIIDSGKIPSDIIGCWDHRRENPTTGGKGYFFWCVDWLIGAGVAAALDSGMPSTQAISLRNHLITDLFDDHISTHTHQTWPCNCEKCGYFNSIIVYPQRYGLTPEYASHLKNQYDTLLTQAREQLELAIPNHPVTINWSSIQKTITVLSGEFDPFAPVIIYEWKSHLSPNKIQGWQQHFVFTNNWLTDQLCGNLWGSVSRFTWNSMTWAMVREVLVDHAFTTKSILAPDAPIINIK
jgi:hypothetical protein